MRNVFIGFFDEFIDFNDYDLCIIFYKRTLYRDLIKKFKDFIADLGHWTCIRWGDEFFDMMVFSKKETLPYRPIYTLRDVNTPFKVDGKPKGWFYDMNGKPKRYTGIGNSMYLSKRPEDTDFSVLLCYMVIKMYSLPDDVITSNMESYSIVLRMFDTFESDTLTSMTQDNEPKDYGSDGKFHFGVNICC